MRKIELRNMFKKIFGREENRPMAYYQTLNEYGPTLAGYIGSDIYDSDIGRTCIDTIARNAAKLTAKHIRRTGDRVTEMRGNIVYLLTVRPNPYMSAYDMLYKVVSQLMTDNNAYIFIQRDELGRVTGFYPISYASLESLEYGGELYCRFSFMNGRRMTVAYSELVHLRRHFNRNDLYGDDSFRTLKPTLALMATINNGLQSAIKNSAKIRGWLKFATTVRPEDMKRAQEAFVRDYLSIDNHGGIAAIDAKYDFIPAKMEQEIADEKQMAFVRENIYRFFGVNEAIVTANYTENQWAAFYESVIEPIAVQLSLEFTSKLFTERERGHGNEIVFEANRLQYASPTTKVAIVQGLLPAGIFTINEAREIFNLAPVDGGDKRLITLNYVDADKQNEYQVGEKTANGKDKENESIQSEERPHGENSRNPGGDD